MKGILFGDYHSYRDLRLILVSKEIGAPAVKVNKIDIPGADSSLDLTDFFGEPKYDDTMHKFTFVSIEPQSQFLSQFSLVKNAIHGKKDRIILDDDPSFFYYGRMHVSSFTNEKNIGNITVECECEPYKYKVNETVVSATLDGTSTNLYDVDRLTLPVTVEKNNDNFLTLDVSNINGSTILYPTLMHSVYAAGEVQPNQAMSLVVEMQESYTLPESGVFFYFTNNYAPQPDYFTPKSYPVLFTNTKDKIVIIPAKTNDAIASAVFFLRSYFSVQSGASIRAKFRLSVVQGTVTADDFVYTSADGTLKGLRLVNSKKRVIPTITATSDFTLYFEGNSYAVKAGATVIPEIELKEGVNDIAVKGAGTISFAYREGTL